ncbi:maleylpyruvate isomerase family mycothiol-dependent enzyme [Glycomyces sp. TRM65418]|uniref:maleylpyruvate isomerase family mycothiol-dependent enzyme n=1 Tax=Glycomyces sp. TRM65418 TaxID=2867006 RepID=UPI001CE4B98F|nr:maleylpyruvate isomerase family mycothiol-dependent enzyme [Glycomyces sp. TRM65418]MCC3761614.1 maleylpyruvate isomerase family mycothiol-dependent enzyme [Glycomyces sp. TRM65418]QZD55710.1 maleylpyruvate isomerase family mycothiol-dependent enzyme [Glycomyces sp. TRM65418]
MERDDPRFAEQTRAERERLSAVFDDLEPAQWAEASLCEGWRVREVLAHMTMPFRLSGPGFLGGMMRARFRFDVFADRDARRAASAMTDRELAALYRSNIGHPWSPPGGGRAGALSHEVVHGLDITEPLGLPAPPAERIGLVLSAAGPRNLAHFGVDLTGRRLVAADADAAVGDGEELRLPVKDVLLVVTGRKTLADATEGR